MASPIEYIDTDESLADVVELLCDQPRYALDTEFHRERTYYPKLALVQIAWEGGLVLIDPLAIDMHPMAKLMQSNALAVLHACTQDLEVLDQACGEIPRRLFDTQVAAGFLGLSTPSLASLHERELGVHLAKGNRLTDWLSRPLKKGQLDYAASDVARLLEIHDRLLQQLENLSRVEWAEAECEIVRTKHHGPRPPDEAWLRIKEARHLKGRSVSVARSVAAWREERAASIDQPARFVIPDMAVVSISQAAPDSPEALARIRGVDKGMARGNLGKQILEAVAEGLELDWRPPKSTNRRDQARELRPAVALVAAWVNQIAHDKQLDPALLAARADVEALVRGDTDARLATGWRADIAGEPIKRLVSGDAALAFDRGIVVLEDRSRRPVRVD